MTTPDYRKMIKEIDDWWHSSGADVTFDKYNDKLVELLRTTHSKAYREGYEKGREEMQSELEKAGVRFHP